jgi:uncharacterized protein YbjT (DUF2867 family)
MSMAVGSTILLVGGTGQQGAAAADALTPRGFKVHVLTRDPGTPKAKSLAARGAELVRGDIHDRASLDRAMSGVAGVFCVAPLVSPFVRAAGGQLPEQMYEQQLAGMRNVVDAAKAASVSQFVFSSVASTVKGTNKNVENKFQVEDYIRASGLPASFLRPVQFMDNCFLPEWGLQQGIFTTALAPNARLQMIAARDIGIYAALMFERPHGEHVRILELAGDELTAPEMAAALSQALGRPIPYLQISTDLLMRLNEDAGKGCEQINSGKLPSVDTRPAREFHPGLLTFSAWLAAEGAERIKPLLPTRPGGFLTILPAWRVDAILSAPPA